MKKDSADKIGKNRLPNGKFAKGNCANPNGRPKNPEAEELRQALLKATKKHNKSFLEHFVDRAYKSDTVAIALAKKILPDQVESDIIGDIIVAFRSGSRLLSRTEAENIPSERG